MSESVMGGFKSVTYESDEGTNYNLTLSEGMIAAVGAAPGDPSYPEWGPNSGRNRVRVCYGVTADGLHRIRIPCPTLGIQDAVFEGGDLNVGGTVYTITGRRGERVSRHRF